MEDLRLSSKNFYRKRVSCFSSEWMSFSSDNDDLLVTLPPDVLVKKTYAVVKTPGATDDKIDVKVNTKIIGGEIPIGHTGVVTGAHPRVYFKNGAKVNVVPHGTIQTSPQPVFRIVIEYIELDLSKGTSTGGA